MRILELNTNCFFKGVALLLLLLLPSGLTAQLSNTLYFNKYNLRQHKVNPAYVPDAKFYIGMPGISTVAVSGGNSRFVFDDLFQNVDVNGKKQTLLFCDKNADGMLNFMNQLKFKERVFAASRVDLIDFGFRLKHNNYLTVGVSNRMETMAIVPHQMFDFVFNGMTNNADYDFRINRLSVSSTVYSELSLGYSHKLNDKLTLGGALKYLYGHANVYTDFYDLSIVGSSEEWYIEGDASIHASVPGLRFVPNDKNQIDEVQFDDDEDISFYAKPQGHGVALDLGLTYQIVPNLQFSASVLDLGFIRWKNNLSELDKTEDFVYDGPLYDINDDSTNYYESYGDQLKSIYEVNLSPNAYTSALSAKFNVGAEYSFIDNRLGIGLLSKTYVFRRTAWEEFLLSANYRPSKWVSLTLTYGMFDGEWNSLSAGMNFNLGPVNLYMAMDNIPLNYAKSNDVTFPSNKRYLRANVGVAYLFKYKEKKIKDEDGDGVPDKIDLCPGTLAGVMVDSLGCPLDADKDGVPDYLDQCDSTLAGVLVDTLGCPLDSDGDGVPDYLDKCSDTPVEALGKVDSVGCPLDSDGDGVPDYLDLCPNTPVEAYGKINDKGCPLDRDNDGIADYWDKCPDEPGVLKNTGCPEVKEEAKQIFKKALNGIQFQTGKSIIKKSSYGVLNQVVLIMQDNPSYKLNITGHTDNVGSPEKNKVLSEQRAESVKKYLVNKGVDPARIKTKGMGDHSPVESNTTPKGRALNRRVELEAEY